MYGNYMHHISCFYQTHKYTYTKQRLHTVCLYLLLHSFVCVFFSSYHSAETCDALFFFIDAACLQSRDNIHYHSFYPLCFHIHSFAHSFVRLRLCCNLLFDVITLIFCTTMRCDQSQNNQLSRGIFFFSRILIPGQPTLKMCIESPIQN